MKTQTISRSMAMPADPYDVAAWEAFYAANPGHRRSVGAEGVNDDAGGGDEGSDADDTDGDEGDEQNAGTDKGDKDGGADANKPSDKEAQLIKDMMRHKEAARKAKAEAEARAKELADLQERFSGIDADEVRNMMAEKAKAEENAALARGEFDKVRAKMVEQHKKALSEKDEALTGLQQTVSQLEQRIQDLTIGADFGNSRFLTEETVLSPRKARTLYGDHFDIVEGKVVAYDQPRGVEGRSPIVDADGNPVAFDEAMRKIVEADPDRDTLLRAKVKAGAASAPAKGTERAKQKPKAALDKISAGLKSFGSK